MSWLWLGVAAAATWTVDPGDTAALSTIGEAVAAASDGDTVAIAAGSYAECVDTLGLDLALVGTDGSTATTVTGAAGCDAALAVTSGSVSVTGLTLSNAHGRGLAVTDASFEGADLVIAASGRTDWGGGGAYVGAATFTLSDCVLRDNQASHGAGLYVDQGVSLALSDCEISGNSAAISGGGLYAYAYNDVALTDVTLAANTALDGSGGGAVVSWYTPLSLTRVTVQDNEASSTGGGLYLYATDADVAMDAMTVSGNRAGSSGGGVEAVWWNRMTVTDSLFEYNEAGGYGGALTNWYDGSLTLIGTRVVSNTATSSGGAIAHYPNAAQDLRVQESVFEDNLSGGSGGAIWAVYGRDVSLVDSTFTVNECGSGSSGGAVEVYVMDSAVVTGSRFCGNEGGYGGAVTIQWTGSDSVANNVFQGNAALLGGALYRYASYTGEVLQNTFVANEAMDWGGGYYTSWSYGKVTNNVFAHTRGGNGVYAQEASTAVSSPLRHDGWWANTTVHAGGYFFAEDGLDGNVVGGPGFVAWSDDTDCTNDDLRFGQDSPFKDAGDPERLDLDGSASDLGAWGGEGAPVEDRDGDGADTTADCDDTDAAILPGAEDVPLDGVDQDCDGVDAEPEPVDTGDSGAAVDTADTGDTETGGDSSPTGPTDSDEPTDEGGCGCASVFPGALWTGWLLALMVPLRRRGG